MTRESGPDEFGIDFDTAVEDGGKAQGELPGLANKKGDTDKDEEEELLLFHFLVSMTLVKNDSRNGKNK